MIKVIIVVAFIAIVIGAIAYIIREKKKGTVCVGCPHAGTCTKHKKQI